MPTIDDGAISLREKPGRDLWPIRVVRSTAIIIAIPLWLGACSLPQRSEPAPIASPTPPVALKPTPGPIALVPSMTGTPLPPPAPARPPAPPPRPATAVATAPPLAPPPAPAAAPPVAPPPPLASTQPAAPPAAPATADAIAAPPSIPCPPGTMAMWSEPDLAGTPVAICRRLAPPR